VPGKGRPFPAGNPGKPKGAKDRQPRGLVRRLVLELLSDPHNIAAHMNALRAMAISPRTALQFSEYAARLNREIGGREDGKGGATTIIFRSNIDPMALRAAAPRTAKVDAAGPPSQRRPRE
jgi:hypothetical protein